MSHPAGPLVVLGGPGSGKTTALVELAAHRVTSGLDPSRLLLLAPSRRSAALLRDRVAARLGRIVREPVARTAHSYAFGLLRQDAVRRGLPAPRLLSGAEQELMIAEMLGSDAARWPADARAALRTRSFAGQLRDLLLRAEERGLGPDDLAELGRRHDRPLWVAAAAFAAEYLGVTALAHPGAYDPAELVRAATDLLRADPVLRDEERSRRALVLVDDYSEADPALVDLLGELADGGRDLVVAGDPDTSVFGFRGADGRALLRFREQFGHGGPAAEVVLGHNHRLPAALLEVAGRVARRLGGPAGHRTMRSTRSDAGQVEVALLAGRSDEVAHVAAHLRARHLRHGVPWHEMAVLARSAADLAGLRRALARHEVPVAQRSDEVALWQHTPVRALLDLLAVVTGRDRATPERVADLLQGPFGGLDPVRLAGVRRRLLERERAAGGSRSADEVLLAVVCDPGETEPDDEHLRPLRRVLRAGRRALPHGSVEQTLWTMWDAAAVAERWRRDALAGGPDGAAADRDLDAVLGLFEAAAAFTDRLPGAGPSEFLDHVRAQQIPSPGWSGTAPEREAVSVLTAHAAKDREWDTVVVVRVQDQLWPDLRRRDTVLGTGALVDLLDMRRLPSSAEQVSALLAAERRLFLLAVTRARASLLVTAVDDGEDRPSRFLADLDPEVGTTRPREPGRLLTLPRMVAELRAAVCDPAVDDDARHDAAALLDRLASVGVTGAHPDEWYGLAPTSDSGPLVEPDEPVRLSPSQVEGYLRCPLRWLLQRGGGQQAGALRAEIGSLVHRLAQETAADDLTPAQVWQRYEQLWGELDVGRGWVARRERARVDAMVTRLLAWLESSPRRHLGSEVEVQVRVDDVVVAGRVDRVERDTDGSVVVVDFKTGASAPSRAEAAANPQLAVYQWAVGQGALGSVVDGEAASGGAVLVHLGASSGPTAKEQWQPSLEEAEDPGWPAGLVREVGAGARGSVFAALVNASCPACPVRTSCPAHPEGRRVTP